MILRSLIIFILSTAPAFADVWSFGTPSGNIECVVGEGFEGSDIQCTIYQRSTAANVPGLSGCPISRGITFSMLNTGRVSGACAAPGARPTGTQSVAEYNVEGRFGGLVCYSATSGLQCRNESGHGFHLSRSNQQVF
jgi:hypothetical protein